MIVKQKNETINVLKKTPVSIERNICYEDKSDSMIQDLC